MKSGIKQYPASLLYWGAGVDAGRQGGDAKTFTEILRDTYGASEIYPTVDIASGTDILAAVNPAHHGMLSGWALQNAIGPVANTLAPYVDGTDDTGVITALGADFNGAIGSAIVCGRVPSASVWSDGVDRHLFYCQVNSSNRIYVYKHGTLGLYAFVTIGGVSKAFALGIPAAMTDWFMVGLSWKDSANGNEGRAYLNGVQVGATYTGFTNPWSGTVTFAKFACANNAPVAGVWKGWPAYVAFKFGAVWTPTDMANIFAEPLLDISPYTANNMVAYGDSVTAGGNASDDAHTWASLVATAQTKTRINAGIGGTILQNTAQNSVPNLGAAAVNNGRDTYLTRVVPYSPSLVCILYGLNDIRLNDAAITAANFETDLGQLIDGLVAAGIAASNIVIGSPPLCTDYTYYGAPWDGGDSTKHAAYVAACAAVATAKSTKYADVYQAMIDNGGAVLMDTDGTHPVDAGHAVIANAFLAALA